MLKVSELEDELEGLVEEIWKGRNRKDSGWIHLIYELSSSLIGREPEKGPTVCEPLAEVYDINLLSRSIEILKPEIEWEFLIEQLEERKEFILQVRAPWVNLIQEEFPSQDNAEFIINQFSKNIKPRPPLKDLQNELNRILGFISKDDRIKAWDALFKQFFLYLEKRGLEVTSIAAIIQDIMSKERVANEAATTVKGLVVLSENENGTRGKVVPITLQMVEDRLYSLDEKDHFEAAIIRLLDYFRKRNLNIPSRGWRYIQNKENQEKLNYKGNSDTLAKVLGVAAIHLKLKPKDDIAITGDMVEGKVHPIEGIKDKLESAANDESIKTILVPNRNKGEIKDSISEKVKILSLDSRLEDVLYKYFGKEEVQNAIVARIEEENSSPLGSQEVIEGLLNRFRILAKKYFKRVALVIASILGVFLLTGSLVVLNTILRPKICFETFPDNVSVFVDDQLIGHSLEGVPLCTRLRKLGQKQFDLRLKDELKLYKEVVREYHLSDLENGNYLFVRMPIEE